MLGKVHGPYQGKQGRQFVIIILHNEDGTIKERKTISFDLYQKEYADGKHRYEKYVKQYSQTPQAIRRRIGESVFRNPPVYRNCLDCNKSYLSHKENPLDLYFCSDQCRDKYKRRQKRSKFYNPIRYYQQVVIQIKGEDNSRWLIIYDIKPGNRDSFFVEETKTSIIISDDDNGVTRLELDFDREKAVRVRLVPGYKKLFWITETGVLISRRTRKVLTQALSETGYWTHASRIGGRKSGFHINVRIHRCVGWAFIPNPDNKPFINHKDGIKTNNHYTNLEWVTNQENIDHAKSMGLLKPLKGEQVFGALLKDEDVPKVRELYASGNYTYFQLAEIFNSSIHSIGDCVRRDSYRHIS